MVVVVVLQIFLTNDAATGSLSFYGSMLLVVQFSARHHQQRSQVNEPEKKRSKDLLLLQVVVMSAAAAPPALRRVPFTTQLTLAASAKPAMMLLSSFFEEEICYFKFNLHKNNMIFYYSSPWCSLYASRQASKQTDERDRDSALNIVVGDVISIVVERHRSCPTG